MVSLHFRRNISKDRPASGAVVTRGPIAKQFGGGLRLRGGKHLPQDVVHGLAVLLRGRIILRGRCGRRGFSRLRLRQAWLGPQCCAGRSAAVRPGWGRLDRLAPACSGLVNQIADGLAKLTAHRIVRPSPGSPRTLLTGAGCP